MPMVMMIVLVEMGAGFDLMRARKDEDVPAGADYLDRSAVEAREHRRRDHLVNRAERRLAAAEIKHPVDRTEQLVQFVSTEKDCDLHLPGEPPREVDDRLLIAWVEAD